MPLLSSPIRLANAMFELPLVEASTRGRAGLAQWLSEAADTFAGIRPADVPAFLVAQLVGGLVAWWLALTPRNARVS